MLFQGKKVRVLPGCAILGEQIQEISCLGKKKVNRDKTIQPDFFHPEREKKKRKEGKKWFGVTRDPIGL